MLLLSSNILPSYPCSLNIDVNCGQPGAWACVKVLHLWSTLLIDLLRSFEQTAPRGAELPSTAGEGLLNGPHSRTTGPLPQHLLLQLLSELLISFVRLCTDWPGKHNICTLQYIFIYASIQFLYSWPTVKLSSTVTLPNLTWYKYKISLSLYFIPQKTGNIPTGLCWRF